MLIISIRIKTSAVLGSVLARHMSDHPVVDSKRELAQLLARPSTAPEQALRNAFKKTMNDLEKAAHTEFGERRKERAWKVVVIPGKLNKLKETFASAVYEQMLNSFSEQQAETLLADHKRFLAQPQQGRLVYYDEEIIKAYAENRQNMMKALEGKAASMADEWEPEIKAAFEKEGIRFPSK